MALPALLALAACGGGGGTSTLVCMPPCPLLTHCAEGGCVADVAPPDLGSSASTDLALGCVPACSGPTPHCNDQLHCVACLSDANCPAGQICRKSGGTAACVAGCLDDTGCGGGNQRCCNGQCADTSQDPLHCGGCGTACMSNHALPACVGGACQAGACSAGFGDCNHDRSDGCEANLRVDPLNCTACGTRCAFANAAAACADGCYIRACLFGFDDCDGKPDNGCETRTSADPKNCGGCAIACTPPPHAISACLNSACVLSACQGLWLDCDGNVANGCEVDGNADKANCGSCGNACGQGLICKAGGCTCPQCNIPNAAARCINNVCILDKCNPGFADCDGNPQNGCEVDINNDAANCGGCKQPCPMNMNVCFQAMCTDVPKVPFFNSMPVATGHTQRGGGNSCGTQVAVGNADVLVRALAVSTTLSQDGNIKFMIWDHANKKLLYLSDPKAFKAGGGWMESDPFSFTLSANTNYDIGGISDVGATWDYDTVSENMGGVRSVVMNPNWTNYQNPVHNGNAGADCGIQLF